jgi:hypothetical protein
MKTADSIEQQEERKAARDDGSNAHSLRDNTHPVTQKKDRYAGYADRIAPWRWQPGKSANPGGRPKHDYAADVARAIFENNPQLVYKAFLKAIAKGNAYAFQVLADRGYGKLKETIHAEVSPYRDMTEEELRDRIARLQEQLGILPAHIKEDEPEKPN